MCEAATKRPEPIRYTVRFPAPATHYLEVEAQFPLESQASVEVFLPVWTPGSYLVREYARNIEAVQAFEETGTRVAVEKTRKNRWRATLNGSRTVTFKYRVYCRELSVRTDWVDENFALLNGAATFFEPVGEPPREHTVRVELPAGWKTAVSGMDEIEPNTFAAPDYDTLVDSPIFAGNPLVQEFEVAGIRHYIVNGGETRFWDAPRALADTQKIVRQNLEMWGSLPYRKYLFLNLIVDASGGLEHRNSCTLMTSRYATRTPKTYLDWLALVSHEYFHAWNVKRLRPVELGPFDYEIEAYTRSLWIAEGFTEYYGGLNVRRAGLASDADYLGKGAPNEQWNASLSSLVTALQTTPGRLAQPLETSSFDAWIKLYRPDENTPNSAISYYVKGAVMAWLLDAKVRAATGGAKSLDDVMREAFRQYSGSHGYTTEQFVALAGDVAGTDLRPWFKQNLETTEELDYRPAMDWFGLHFKAPEENKNGGRKKAWIGAQTRNEAGRVIVRQIPLETPASQSDLSVEDEILAIDGYRVTPENLQQRLEQYQPGDSVQLLVARREKIVRLPLQLGEEPPRKWQIEPKPDATSEQKQRLAAWLSATASKPVLSPK
jgi:predicted metalloprotease with PDZ domain